jgi:hypothetical protein
MLHPTPTKVLLATTLQPLVVQLSGSLAHGAKLIAQFLEQEPTPQKMATFERELSALLREVGRRIVAWVCNHVEPECPAEAPARLCHVVWPSGRLAAPLRTAGARLAVDAPLGAPLGD